MAASPSRHFAMLLFPWNLPVNASAHGVALDHHLLLNLWVILALAALGHILLLTGLALRRSSAPRSLLRFEYLPLAAFAILFATLAIQAERLWAAKRYTGASPTALQVEVTAMQFAWYFRYPGPDAIFGITRSQLPSAAEANPLGIDPADPHGNDDIVTSELVLPSDREIDLRLQAQDVIHGFSVPELRLKQNAIPGETVHIHFTPSTPGTYAILCTQLCGTGHYRMNASLRIVPPDQYVAWVASKQKAAQP